MTTRSATAAAAIMEDELPLNSEMDALRLQVRQLEQLLQEQGRQTETKARETDTRLAELKEIEQRLTAREDALNRRENEIALESSPFPATTNMYPSPQPTIRFLDTAETAKHTASSPLRDSFHTYRNPPLNQPTTHFPFKNPVDRVPSFNGHNIPLVQYVSACRQAQESAPPHAEYELTAALIDKLYGDAYSVVAYEPCSSVTQLIKILTGSFGRRQSAMQWKGDISAAYQKPSECIQDFVLRVKTLRMECLEAMRRETLTIPHNIIQEIDEFTAQAFCNGLIPPYRARMLPEHRVNPFDAFQYAREIASQEAIDREKYGDIYSHTKPPRSRDDRNGNPFLTPRAPQAPRQVHSYNQPHNTSQSFARETPRDNYRNTRQQNHNTRNSTTLPPREWNRAPPRDVAQRWCRYCKNLGHEIHECRKKRYNENRTQSGNGHSPSGRTDAPRAEMAQPSRPVTAITTETPDDNSSQ